MGLDDYPFHIELVCVTPAIFTSVFSRVLKKTPFPVTVNHIKCYNKSRLETSIFLACTVNHCEEQICKTSSFCKRRYTFFSEELVVVPEKQNG